MLGCSDIYIYIYFLIFFSVSFRPRPSAIVISSAQVSYRFVANQFWDLFHLLQQLFNQIQTFYVWISGDLHQRMQRHRAVQKWKGESPERQTNGARHDSEQKNWQDYLFIQLILSQETEVRSRHKLRMYNSKQTSTEGKTQNIFENVWQIDFFLFASLGFRTQGLSNRSVLKKCKKWNNNLTLKWFAYFKAELIKTLAIWWKLS